MIAEKERLLREIVRGFGSCIVAFSGGVDSALMLHIANEELGSAALGITARSESLAEREYAEALAFGRATGASHEVIETQELGDARYAENSPDRCFYCKSELYGRLKAIAVERGFRTIVDGYNVDDASDIRPGRRAAAAYGVRSPLFEAGMGKQDVRDLARELGLSVWDKPALACLSSRFPHGTPISLESLRQVDRAERAVHDGGIRVCRVRHYGDLARIEVGPDEVALFDDPARRERIFDGVRAAGYRVVTLDAAGYRRGGANAG